MNEVYAGLAYLFLFALSALLALKVMVWVVRVSGNSCSETAGWNRLRRMVPDWELFGQSSGTFDIYVALSDDVGSEGQHLHVTPPTEAWPIWLRPLLDPLGRYRVVCINACTELWHLSDALGSSLAEASPYAAQVREIARASLHELHGHCSGEATFFAYVVVDRGFFSSEPPEAKVMLGPFGAREQ